MYFQNTKQPYFQDDITGDYYCVSQLGVPQISTSQSLPYRWSNSVFIGQLDRDGGWSEWSSFGDCSADQNTPSEEGNRIRTRSCDNPPKLNSGQDCIGLSTEVKKCQGFPSFVTTPPGKHSYTTSVCFWLFWARLTKVSTSP